MTHGEARRKALERYISGGDRPSLQFLTARSQMPPPMNQVIRAMLDSTQYYGVLYGRKTCGVFRRLYWANINFLSIFLPVCFGLRSNEAVVIKREDFIFDPKDDERIKADIPPVLAIVRGDTATGETKTKEPRGIPIPTKAIPLYQQVFKALELKPSDFVLSGKDSGHDLPITVDQLEVRWKVIAKVAAQRNPDLGINLRHIYPYVARQKVATLVNDLMKDGGIYSSVILGHRGSGGKAQSRMTREHYIRPPYEALRDAMDKALEEILRDLKAPSVKPFLLPSVEPPTAETPAQ